ncbi:C1q-like domain-containing protein [Brevibacillus brevis]|uniref:Cyclic nucleotide-binding domain-containing protein n=1 Tax=Brevibacillus brevis TaxID=1393 RepID=A0ABY9T9A0_BREBE|nr:hypothetical protein [Brevibacillus brevis]WNC16616.1 hypothetical protein RGB73_09950 [Brevibacillus brevis]
MVRDGTSTESFLIAEAGSYLVTYELNVESGGSVFGLFVNGTTLVSGSNYAQASEGLLSGHALLTLQQNDVVSVKLLNGTANLANVVNGNGVVSASIIFEKMAAL